MRALPYICQHSQIFFIPSNIKEWKPQFPHYTQPLHSYHLIRNFLTTLLYLVACECTKISFPFSEWIFFLTDTPPSHAIIWGQYTVPLKVITRTPNNMPCWAILLKLFSMYKLRNKREFFFCVVNICYIETVVYSPYRKTEVNGLSIFFSFVYVEEI